jgi:trans-aconitate methyltransferase
MDKFDLKKHWDNIYEVKKQVELSWFELVPTLSLDFIKEFQIPMDASIIDIGGGDSLLVDYLVQMGYSDITILDISANALDRAKQRLGERAGSVKWIVADVAQFKPDKPYDFWHDRAAFHFLTKDEQISYYHQVVRQALKDGGYLVIGTFSPNGPDKCSGIPIKKYSENELVSNLQDAFIKVKCITADHVTPWGALQNFNFCSFKKISA